MTLSDASLTGRFESARPRLSAIGYRMLGSIDDAQDAVQEAWLRLSSCDEDIKNLDAWLTTVVARICLNKLRDRRARDREELVAHLPDPILEAEGEYDPEHRALLADAVGLALFVVLDTLPPAERLAFVLHDVFNVPFDQIAPIVHRTPDATRRAGQPRTQAVEEAEPSRTPHGRAARGPSTPFSRRDATATSTSWCRRWIPAWCCAATSALAPPCSGPRAPPPGRRTGPQLRGTGREVHAAMVNSAAGAIIFVAGRRRRSWDSSSAADESPRSTCWPTRSASCGPT